jgi:nitroreductase
MSCSNTKKKYYRRAIMFFYLLKNRRSIRKYKEQEIEKDKIEKLMKAALFSPSSKARYPCEFIFVNDKKLLAKLSQSKPHGSAFLANVPLGIVVTADSTKSDVWIEDASIATTFILLAAETLGLGACWIQIRKRKYSKTIDSEEYIRNILSIPDNRRVLAMVGVGYPDETKMPRQEGDLEYDKIFFNQYGNY